MGLGEGSNVPNPKEKTYMLFFTSSLPPVLFTHQRLSLQHSKKMSGKKGKEAEPRKVVFGRPSVRPFLYAYLPVSRLPGR